MNYRALKSGRFACADPAKPHLILIKGNIVETDEATLSQLFDAGWIELLIEPESSTESTEQEIPSADIEKEQAEEIQAEEVESTETKRRPGGRRRTKGSE